MRRLFFALLIMMMTMVTANAQTLTEHEVQEGASNEWCEPVDDANYDALK
jgi:hypothetical protein